MDYDVIVVGAGSAGGVVASRLSERADRSVLLLEAGPDFGATAAGQPPDVADAYDVTSTGYDWGYRSQPGTLGREVPLFAGRLVGGSSATNNVMALRGQPADYDGWAAGGLPGWSFAEVLPAFQRLERDLDHPDRWHGDRGPVPVHRYHTVVDRTGRVRGVDGLAACDASIMPAIPSANTNLPTLMVAERCAELLSARPDGA